MIFRAGELTVYVLNGRAEVVCLPGGGVAGAMINEDSKWNPRYLCYARFHNRTPFEQQRHDREVAYPASPGTGFILWMSYMKQEFYKVNPAAFMGRHDIADIKAWDDFLEHQSRIFR
jgi:hypothetical protein